MADKFGHVSSCTPAKNDEIDEAVCPETVGAVDGYAGALAGCIQTLIKTSFAIGKDTSVKIGRNSAHAIMGRRLHRTW